MTTLPAHLWHQRLHHVAVENAVVLDLQRHVALFLQPCPEHCGAVGAAGQVPTVQLLPGVQGKLVRAAVRPDQRVLLKPDPTRTLELCGRQRQRLKPQFRYNAAESTPIRTKCRAARYVPRHWVSTPSVKASEEQRVQQWKMMAKQVMHTAELLAGDRIQKKHHDVRCEAPFRGSLFLSPKRSVGTLCRIG